jgi:hypothetical protein
MLVLSLLLPSVALAAKSYGADRFDVDIVLQDDGSLLVTETVIFRFSGGPFTTVFRELETGETDGVIDVVATMDGKPLPAGKGAGQVEIEQGRRIKINWHLPPTSDETHVFGLSYRMLGVVRQQSDADVLSMRVLPAEHDYTIGASTVRITYPSSTRLIADPSVVKGKADITSRAQGVTFQSTDINDDETLQVNLRFEPGSILLTPPQWQAEQTSQGQFVPYVLGLAALLLFGGSGALALYWRRFTRAITPMAASALRTMRPPAERSPAMAGMIKDEAADTVWQHALGTLFDLGQRGVLVIEESPERSRWKPQDFIISLTAQPAGMLPHESALLSLLFGDKKKGRQDSVKMSDMSGAVAARWSTFTKALQGEMRTAGLWDATRERVRRQLMIVAGITLFAGLVAFVPAIALLRVFGPSLMVIPIAIALLSCVAFVFAAAFSPATDAAVKEKAQWQSFAAYLKDVAKGKEPFVGARLLEDYLPYAASFGLAGDWAKLFKQRGDEKIMAWFRPLATAADGGSAAFIAMIGASSSAGASGGAGGAGAGAAGGGASGAH